MRDLDIASRAARAAAKVLNQKHAVTSDAGRDIKSKADTAAEEVIFRHLSETPYAILSEEAGTMGKGVLRWIVDPLDGTVNYSRGLPLSCISIALWDENPILGVVYDFNRDELFTGIVGQGAWLNGSPIQVSTVVDRAQALLHTGFPVASSFGSRELREFIREVQAYKKVRLLGSAALSLAYVACGRGDAYREMSIRLWDVAAGIALVCAAGGRYEKVDITADMANVYADNGVLRAR